MGDGIVIKKLPPYKEMVDRVLERFEKEGYGIFFMDAEVDEWLSIKPIDVLPEYSNMPVEDIVKDVALRKKKQDVERLQKYTAINELLEEHGLLLFKSWGAGYLELLHPSDMVGKGFKKRWDAILEDLRKAMLPLTKADSEYLTAEQEARRVYDIQRVAHVQSQTAPRKLYKVKDGEILRITDDKPKPE